MPVINDEHCGKPSISVAVKKLTQSAKSLHGFNCLDTMDVCVQFQNLPIKALL